MAYSQKYTLVSFVHPISVGTEFDMADWPLHITLADVFAIDRVGTEITAKLSTSLATLPSFSVTADKEAILGTADVVLLHKNPTLLKLHHLLVDLLEANGATFNSPAFTRGGFLPHCTIQKTEHLHTGDKVGIETIALVDMFPDDNWHRRKVLNVFTLAKGSAYHS